MFTPKRDFSSRSDLGPKLMEYYSSCSSPQSFYGDCFIESPWVLTHIAAKSLQSSVEPHRWQPTRLRRPWDSPGKNTGVGCYFLLQCMKVKSESEVAQSGPTLHDPKDCSPPGSSIHGIFQARVLERSATHCLLQGI